MFVIPLVYDFFIPLSVFFIRKNGPLLVFVFPFHLNYRARRLWFPFLSLADFFPFESSIDVSLGPDACKLRWRATQAPISPLEKLSAPRFPVSSNAFFSCLLRERVGGIRLILLLRERIDRRGGLTSVSCDRHLLLLVLGGLELGFLHAVVLGVAGGRPVLVGVDPGALHLDLLLNL